MLFNNQHFKSILLILGLISLSACDSLTPKPTEQVTIQAPVAKVDAALMNQIYDLLDEAHLALLDNRLTTPIDDNAYFRYLKILSLAPNNRDALEGLSAIVDRYLSWSISAIERSQYRRAQDYIYKAKSVDEFHPNIAAVEQRIKNTKQSRQQQFQLDTTALDKRGDSIKLRLFDIAKTIGASQLILTITARTDAEGRWIYQQLNGFTEFRVRAKFKLGGKPNIALKSHQ